MSVQAISWLVTGVAFGAYLRWVWDCARREPDWWEREGEEWWDMDDPYDLGPDELRAMLRFQYGLGLSVSDPRAQYRLPDADLDKLPGQLPRLAREMNEAAPGDAARDAARRFITASEEFIDEERPGG
jgi:hypothetical protein